MGCDVARYAATERGIEAVPPDFRLLALSFRRHLFAENKAPRPVQSYPGSLARFAAFLADRGMPTDPPTSPASMSRRASPTT